MGVEPTDGRRIGAVQRDAQPDGLAVAQRVVTQQLELVGRPVAEVQRTRAAGLERVAGAADVLEVELGAAANDRAERLEGAVAYGGGFAHEQLEERGVADQRDLDRLGQSSAAIALWQRGDEIEVVDHRIRRGEAADGVLDPE